MKSCSRLLTLVTFLAALSPATVWAKDQHGKLGLGYNAQFANATATGGVPAVSLKYGITRDIAAEGLVGVATSTPSNSVVGIKFFKNLFYETNLNFYFMLGGGILSANNRSGGEFLGGFGAEFFIPGIESLGFSVETGGTLENISTGTFILKTMGISFLEAGIHFYF
jgi:hypothetical protein